MTSGFQQLPAKGLMASEPALTTSGGVMFCTLIINALVSYGLPVTLDLKILLVSVVGILGPMVSGVITRSRVFSPTAINELQKGWSQVVDSTSKADPTTSVVQPSTPQRPAT
jgi:hypothetical protein